jgi:hypothetical protein
VLDRRVYWFGPPGGLCVFGAYGVPEVMKSATPWGLNQMNVIIVPDVFVEIREFRYYVSSLSRSGSLARLGALLFRRSSVILFRHFRTMSHGRTSFTLRITSAYFSSIPVEVSQHSSDSTGGHAMCIQLGVRNSETLLNH